jgi:hypothetical protein
MTIVFLANSIDEIPNEGDDLAALPLAILEGLPKVKEGSKKLRFIQDNLP